MTTVSESLSVTWGAPAPPQSGAGEGGGECDGRDFTLVHLCTYAQGLWVGFTCGQPYEWD